MGTTVVAVTVLGVCISALALGALALYFSIRSYIEIEAFKKSTHRIEYVGAGLGDIKLEDSLANVSKINEEYKKNVANDLSFFKDEEETKEESKRVAL